MVTVCEGRTILPAVLAYEDAKRLARDGSPTERAALASRADAQPEVLYYLAEDSEPAVRAAVAANPATPVQASALLVHDTREEVREALARRLACLLPELDARSQRRLHDMAVTALETLAADQVVNVRKMLAETLKDTGFVPQHIAIALARDVERAVAEPILLFCAALEDRDLLEIIRADPTSWRVEAIAGRQDLSGRVSDAVVDSGNERATGILLDNTGAEILPPTLDRIAEASRTRPKWQSSIAQRPRLPAATARKLAAFAEQSVRMLLEQRRDLDPDTTNDVANVMRRRLERIGDVDPSEAPAQRAQRLYMAGRLDDAEVFDAIALDDRPFIVTALALLVRVPTAIIEEMLRSDSPRVVTALAWKAGLTMRTAIQLQLRTAGIAARRSLAARKGTEYPMSEVELLWHLDLYGIKE